MITAQVLLILYVVANIYFITQASRPWVDPFTFFACAFLLSFLLLASRFASGQAPERSKEKGSRFRCGTFPMLSIPRPKSASDLNSPEYFRLNNKHDGMSRFGGISDAVWVTPANWQRGFGGRFLNELELLNHFNIFPPQASRPNREPIIHSGSKWSLRLSFFAQAKEFSNCDMPAKNVAPAVLLGSKPHRLKPVSKRSKASSKEKQLNLGNFVPSSKVPCAWAMANPAESRKMREIFLDFFATSRAKSKDLYQDKKWKCTAGVNHNKLAKARRFDMITAQVLLTIYVLANIYFITQASRPWAWPQLVPIISGWAALRPRTQTINVCNKIPTKFISAILPLIKVCWPLQFWRGRKILKFLIYTQL